MHDDKKNSKDLTNQTKIEKQSDATTSPSPIVKRGSRVEAVSEKPSMASIAGGIIALALTLMLTIFALISVSKPQTPMEMGAIEGSETTRLGTSQTYNYSTGDIEIREGMDVVWYVDDVEVQNSTYHSGDAIQYDFAPAEHGTKQLKVKIGNYFTKEMTVEVQKPVLTFSAPTVTVIYGDEIPELHFDCNGFVGEDTRECLLYDGCVEIQAENRENLKVGVYTLKFSKDLESENYDAEYVTGSLIVVPREVTLSGNFSKEYDGTNILAGRSMNVDGVLNGDEVVAQADNLYFEDKNVGHNKTVSTINVCLEGADASNYVLSKDNNNLYGTICPKRLTLTKTSLHSKMYDGTTAATFENIGELSGVVAGDIVALGGIKASFESAEAGQNKTVNISDISLVGSDKDNYTIANSMQLKADINNNYLNILFNKPQVNAAVK